MNTLHPITFSIPNEKIIVDIPKKTRILSPLVPGLLHTYIYDDELSYYNQYKESMFAITTKKSGWDCCRHYEILACGTIPYFINIHDCPINTMALLPKNLIMEGNELYEKISKYDFNEIPQDLIDEYYILLDELLKYTRRYLTTRSMASYILAESDNIDAKKILYLSNDLSPDYLRCLTLHGFKGKFGLNCTDYPKIPHMYKNEQIQYDKLYGKGITYSNLLDQNLHNRENENQIIENIKNKKYDVIIYGSLHRGILFYDLVMNYYEPKKVIFLCGEDIHSCCHNKFRFIGHHCFVRELTNSSKLKISYIKDLK
jgi:hypothetical protein